MMFDELFSPMLHSASTFYFRRNYNIVNGPIPKHLRFNFGFLLESGLGTSREIELDYPRIQLGDVLLSPLTGQFKASRNSRGIYVKGNLETGIVTECSRCLSDVNVPSELELDLLFFYPASTAPPGEESIEEDGFVDLGPVVREISLLEIPMQIVCRENCAGLCNSCGANLNEEQCDCEKEAVDPRFAVLKQLLESGNEGG